MPKVKWETDNFNTGTTLPDKNVVYKLRFKVIGENGSSAAITGSATPKNGKMIDVEGVSSNIEITTGIVKIEIISGSPILNELKLFEIYPNPNTGSFEIKSGQSFDKVEVLNSAGLLLYEHIDPKQSMIDISSFGSGIFYLKLQTNNQTFIKKVIVVK